MTFTRRSNPDRTIPILHRLYLAALMVLVLTFSTATSCASTEFSEDASSFDSVDFPATTTVFDAKELAREATVVVEREVEVAGATVLQTVAPVPATDAPAELQASLSSGDGPADETTVGQQGSGQSQTSRIIVRDAEMRIEVRDPADAVDRIGDLADRRGGWIVSRESTAGAFFTITIRVPADQLDDAIDEITDLSAKVISSSSQSRDFTEEYIDLNARISTLRATRDALQELLIDSQIAADLRQVLEVQQEITAIETQLESIEGRLRFITQSAAFSKLTVRVEASPLPMIVDAGDEKRAPLGHGSQFTARFFPPEDYDRFLIEWDFGDGSGTILQERALRTGDADGSYLSAPVVHTYFDDQYSPYAVTVKVTAYSDNKVAQGEDQLWVHAAELPTLNIFPGEHIEAEVGETVSFRATFDDHIDVGDLSYKWTFGDGSAPIEGVVKDGTTAVDAEHAFERQQTLWYQVKIELSGDSSAGEIRESAEISVRVIEPPSVEGSDFQPATIATEGINTVLNVAILIANAAIWIGVTLPVWILIAAAFYAIYRLIAWWRRRLIRSGP